MDAARPIHIHPGGHQSDDRAREPAQGQHHRGGADDGQAQVGRVKHVRPDKKGGGEDVGPRHQAQRGAQSVPGGAPQPVRPGEGADEREEDDQDGVKHQHRGPRRGAEVDRVEHEKIGPTNRTVRHQAIRRPSSITAAWRDFS
jgi:hypothetical protein